MWQTICFDSSCSSLPMGCGSLNMNARHMEPPQRSNIRLTSSLLTNHKVRIPSLPVHPLRYGAQRKKSMWVHKSNNWHSKKTSTCSDESLVGLHGPAVKNNQHVPVRLKSSLAFHRRVHFPESNPRWISFHVHGKSAFTPNVSLPSPFGRFHTRWLSEQRQFNWEQKTCWSYV